MSVASQRARWIEEARADLTAKIGTYQLSSPTGAKLLAMFEAMHEAEEWCDALDRDDVLDPPR